MPRSRIQQFFHTEVAGCIVMLAAAVFAMVMANTALGAVYAQLVHLPLVLGAPLGMETTLGDAVKDGLMVLFFLLVGLELKRELCVGALRDRKQAALPLVAAIGGMVAPALVFLAVTHSYPEYRAGWAIPSATDIAFAVCVLSLASRRVPVALKVFLLALAIFDDLGAILIIAFFYSQGLAVVPLAAAVGCALALFLLNGRGVAAPWPYLLLGVGLAVLLHEGGIHPTIAGVVVGMAVPLDAKGKKPLAQWIRTLHPWVSYLVLPLFAFTAAGLSLTAFALSALLEPLPLGIAVGLVVGKPLGILAASIIACRLGLADLPQGTDWRGLSAVGLMAGVGFTMSLFIGQLAFTDALMFDRVKLGVMAGSLLAAALGSVLLRRVV